MACDHKTLKLLSIYVDGEAGPAEAAQAEAHLQTCHECQSVVREWQRGLEMLDWAYRRSLPDDVAEPVFEPPIAQPAPSRRRWTLALPDLRIPVFAAVSLLIALMGFLAYRQIVSVPTLGRMLVTSQRAQTILVAAGIRVRLEPDTEVARLGDRAISLAYGTINAKVTGEPGFTIRTRKLEIVDEGTMFEVHSDPKTDRVTVKEGRVLVREGNSEYHVGAGETLTSTGDRRHNDTKVERNGVTDVQSQVHIPHGGFGIGMLPMLILGILFIVFWVKMLVNALTRDFKDSGTKIAWVLVIFFGHLLGALIYYFVVFRKGRADSAKALEPGAPPG